MLRNIIGLFFGLMCLFTTSAHAQVLHKQEAFTHQDTLRGSLNEERTWWDVTHYKITVIPEYLNKKINGRVVISFKVIKPGKEMQIDLQEPMEIIGIVFNSKKLSYRREGNVYHVSFPALITDTAVQQIDILFSGKPREAIRPPWDGGWIWTKDANGNPWMSVACQGLGASVWYPCKDVQSDEPDNGASLTMVVPDNLVAVGNGRLTEKKASREFPGYTMWTWQVVNPINNYNIIPYIGKYVNFTETFDGEKGKLDCSYWVLDYDKEKAQEQFKQAKQMLKCFEYWFGPYPFYEDGYKLVEAPHLGMEHQSAVAYGNKFQNGYLGRDLSGTGWGLKWDFIIVHESGHEWFANNITSKDLADMWLHEGFTNYSETLFTECQFGKEAGSDYVIGTRKNIRNDIPIIGPYGVNREGSGDMYYKGGNLLHTIRQVINDDEKFRNILKGLNKDFYHQTVTTQQVEDYISKKSGIDFSKVFDQYLRTTKIPVLEYKVEGNAISYRWTNCVDGFKMPVKLGNQAWLNPTAEWQTNNNISIDQFTVDRNFYIQVKKV
ncbi:MAG: M1 family metallopeptidase [Chitinophagaceae bacterium]